MFKTKCINNPYFVILVSHITYSKGIHECELWDIKNTCSYYFFRTPKGRFVPRRNFIEPFLCETVVNMSEYILKLVELC